MQVKLRYVAMNTAQPDAMAAYFTRYFGMRETARGRKGEIALSDGWFKLCLFPAWPENEVGGIRHYGIAIDDFGALERRLPKGCVASSSSGDFHGEHIITDPFGGTWAVSARNFGMDDRGRDVHGIPRIRHCAIYTRETQPVLEWVTGMFGWREINVSTKISTLSTFPLRMAGDGHTNFTILPFDFVSHFGLENQRPISDEHRAKQWVPQHFGWVVPDLKALCDALPDDRKDMTMMPENMGEYSALDPDTNRMDISETKGFEVDYNIWERGAGRGGPPPFIMVRNEKGERINVPV